MQPVFIIGEQRSGSNLLRLMLNNSTKIAAPHPPHILLRMKELVPSYGSLQKMENFKLLIDDVCRLIDTNPVPWSKDNFNREIIVDKCKDRSLIAIFKAVMDHYSEVNEASMWVCKSMQNVRWYKELEAYFKKPKYIYLYRDPRDVTLSFQKAVVGHKHPYCIAKKWTDLQALCIEARENIPENRFYNLKYERLIENPEESLKDLCEFLEIEYNKEMLNYYNSNEAKNTAKVSMLWANVKSPLMRKNSGKYLKAMSKDDQAIVESVAHEVMDTLKYERKSVEQNFINFDQEMINKYNFEDKELQSIAELKINPEDLKRRKLQLEVIEEIKKRI